MVKHILWSLSGTILFASCEVIDYHPYDGKLSTDKRHLNEQHIAQIEADTEGKDTLRFVLFGDTQRSYDEMEAFVQHINAQQNDLDFLILETSSFQLESIAGSFAPSTAAFLNLASDHINRHGTLEGYAEAKLRLFRNMEGGNAVIKTTDRFSVHVDAVEKIIKHQRVAAAVPLGEPGGAVDHFAGTVIGQFDFAALIFTFEHGGSAVDQNIPAASPFSGKLDVKTVFKLSGHLSGSFLRKYGGEHIAKLPMYDRSHIHLISLNSHMLCIGFQRLFKAA